MMTTPKRKPQGEGKRIADVEVPAPTDESRSLRERAMLVRAIMGGWTGRGRDAEITQRIAIEAKAKGRVGTYTKEYMDRELLRKVDRTCATARIYHRLCTLPWGDSGARLLPVTAFFEYKTKMTSFERDFAIAVDEFMAGYAKHVQEQKPRLGSLWRAEDYPTEQFVRSQFRFAVIVEPIAMSDDFRVTLSKEESAEIKREYDAEIKARMKGAVQDVFANVQETVAELQSKLADPDSTIRTSSFAALRKLVASLPQLNSIVQDPNITALGKRIAEDLLAVSVDAVAHDVTERSKAHKKADAILAALKPLQQSWATVDQGDSNATE